MKKDWIKQAVNPENKGKLHRALGIPMGKKIPQKALDKAEKKGGKVAAMARLAETLRGFNKR